MQGLGGFLVKPKYFNYGELTNYMNYSICCFFVDDIWISAHCKVDKYVFPAKRIDFLSLFYRKHNYNTSLGKINIAKIIKNVITP